MRDTNFFRACGEALFGGTWQNELARSLGMSLQSGGIRKMASGSLAVSPRTWTRLALLMRQRGMALQALAAQADPQDEAAAHIRETLRDPRPEIVASCLTGMGHYRLGADLAFAAEHYDVAKARLEAVPRRPATAAEKASGDMMAALSGEVYVDDAAAEAAWEELHKATGRLNELKRQVEDIADSLDHGYDPL